MGEAVTIHSYNAEDATAEANLRTLCAEWQYGAHGFWNWHQLSSSLAIPGTALQFARHPDQPARWAGAVFYRTTDMHSELFYIYVSPPFRGKGLATPLLKAWLETLKSGCEAFLEVRPHNAAAIRLYQRHGFSHTDTRPRYYTNGDDALVFKWQVP